MTRIALTAIVAVGFATILGFAAPACAPSFRVCPTVSPSVLDVLPDRLSASGLYADVATDKLADGVRPFAPRFELWSDGADKRRWILLPPGAAVDAQDPDDWDFPVGTRVWKEFRVDGVRVETRMIQRFGPNDDEWAAAAYVWGDDGDALRAPSGALRARGTDHDVPSASDCLGCHRGRRSFVLGFSAIQLPRRVLSALVDERLLLPDATSDSAARDNTLPGDAATQAALGYLHANCAHCHNRDRPAQHGPRCFDPDATIDFFLRVGDLARPDTTATYRTAVGSVIVPGDPDDSEILLRAQSRDPWWGMPALGTRRVDSDGAALLETWIVGLTSGT